MRINTLKNTPIHLHTRAKNFFQRVGKKERSASSPTVALCRKMPVGKGPKFKVGERRILVLIGLAWNPGSKFIGATMEGEPTKANNQALEAFTATISRPRISWLYTIGLAIVAFAMVLLPAIYIALIALAGWGVLYHLTQDTWIFNGSGGMVFRMILYAGPAVAGGILVFFMLKPLFARRPKRAELLSLDPVEEPLLFAFVQRICQLVQAPMPCRIDVDCQVNASASLRRGLWSRDLVLTIGLPLAAGLDMRQFAGVLAHEFGHFAQGAGMRLTYVIRNINFWFARVVFERDKWDQQLEQSAKRVDFRVGVMLHAARGCVWLTRRILWALMHAGNAISCFMLRQMEYDADGYESKVAGSDAFESTAGAPAGVERGNANCVRECAPELGGQPTAGKSSPAYQS